MRAGWFPTTLRIIWAAPARCCHQTARPLATYDYWPYGQVLATGGTDVTPFKFTGHERDSESGLDFMPFRTYGSERLRFLQVDPAAEKYPGLSPYAYAANNPLTFIDVRGDTLDVGGMNDGQTALSYLHSMVDEDTAKRITMGDGGRVSFDTEGSDLSQDSGLELLNNLVNGPGMFLFEVVEKATISAPPWRFFARTTGTWLGPT